MVGGSSGRCKSTECPKVSSGTISKRSCERNSRSDTRHEADMQETERPQRLDDDRSAIAAETGAIRDRGDIAISLWREDCRRRSDVPKLMLVNLGQCCDVITKDQTPTTVCGVEANVAVVAFVTATIKVKILSHPSRAMVDFLSSETDNPRRDIHCEDVTGAFDERPMV